MVNSRQVAFETSVAFDTSVAFESGHGVGGKTVFVGIVSTLLHGKRVGLDRDHIIKVRLAVLTAAAAASGGAGTDDDDAVRFGYNFNRLNVGDVKMTAQHQINTEFAGKVERLSSISGDIVGTERLNLGQVMMDDQHLEVMGRGVPEEGAKCGPLAVADAPALDGASMSRVDAENGQPVEPKGGGFLVADEVVEACQRTKNSGERPPPGVNVVVSGNCQRRRLHGLEHCGGGLVLHRTCSLRQVAANGYKIGFPFVHLSDDSIDDAWMGDLSEVEIG